MQTESSLNGLRTYAWWRDSYCRLTLPWAQHADLPTLIHFLTCAQQGLLLTQLLTTTFIIRLIRT